MAKDRIITTIDIGSSKIAVLIAEYIDDESIQIIGVASVISKGVKKGVIVDIDQAVDSINEALEAAERMAGIQVTKVWITVNGNHIASVNSQGVVAVASADGEISANDVERVIEAAKAISIPSSREIIHVLPRTFIVDQQEGIDDPIGMSGNRLQVETHIITGAATSMRNLIKSVQQVGLDVDNVIFSGLATGESLLTETEKELGVVVVDIGGGTTDLVVYQEGAPTYSSVIKLGGKNITSDIAIGLRVPLEDAETIKKYVSTSKNTPVTSAGVKTIEDEFIDISELALPSLQKIERKYLVEGIIEPRLEEIAEEIEREISKSGFDGLTPAGVVIGGGTAQTIGLQSVFSKILDMPVRIAQPTGVTGLIDEIKGPDYAASVGSILYATHHHEGSASMLSTLPKLSLNFGGFQTIKNKIVGLFKGFSS